MILKEIVNVQHTKTKVDNFDLDQINKDRDEKISDPNVKNGFFSAVRPDPNDPHMIDKQNFFPEKFARYDPYFTYILKASKYAKSNPFFPRVYNINLEVGEQDGLKRPSFKMEKLIPMNQLSKHELLAASAIIDPWCAEAVQRELQQPYASKFYVDTFIIAVILDFVGNGFRSNGSPRFISNPLLSQAIKLIKGIAKRNQNQKKNFFLDTKEDNYMFRRTPYGPQLVITDPIGKTVHL